MPVGAGPSVEEVAEEEDDDVDADVLERVVEAERLVDVLDRLVLVEEGGLVVVVVLVAVQPAQVTPRTTISDKPTFSVPSATLVTVRRSVVVMRKVLAGRVTIEAVPSLVVMEKGTLTPPIVVRVPAWSQSTRLGLQDSEMSERRESANAEKAHRS